MQHKFASVGTISTSLWLATFASHVAAAVIYVDDSATRGGDNGTSWADAFVNLQDGLAAAQAGDEVRVAGGIYKPAPPGAGTASTFAIIDEIVRGGYAGLDDEGGDPDANDPSRFITILSGDLNANDPGGAPTETSPFADNVRHVVTLSGSIKNAQLAGFHITGGFAHDSSAAIDGQGGGVINAGGNATIVDCVFAANTAWRGGAIANRQNAQSTLINCTFSNNRCMPGGYGGAIYNLSSSATINACQFTANGDTFCLGVSAGGAMYSEASDVSVADCTFTSNKAAGGGAVLNHSTTGSFQGCTFQSNCAEGGGGMSSIYSSLTITQCAFIGNGAELGGGVYNHTAGATHFENCTFHGNTGLLFGGGGMANDASSPTLLNCTFRHNLAGGFSSVATGGAIRNNDASSPSLINCEFFDNTSEFGGGMFSENASNPALTNCTFAQNHANAGGPGGPGGPAGGALHSFGSTPIVSNSIVWGNTPLSIVGPATFTYSNVEGGWPGEGNINADPMFVNQSPPDGDLRLAQGSPCIDAGNNAAVPPGVKTDLAGEERFVDDPATKDTGAETPPIVDMGAFEFQPPTEICVGDIAPHDPVGDGIVNVDDLLALLAAWGACTGDDCPADLNGDDQVDVDDLLDMLAAWGECE